MLKFLFSLIVLNFSILSIASAQNSYELGKTYTFSSGDVEMTVKLDEKGIATVSRKKVAKYAEPSVVFFGKDGDFKYTDKGTVEFKDEKTASKYWFIPFNDEPVARGGNITVVVNCPCADKNGKGPCDVGFSGTPNGSTITTYCTANKDCPQCGSPTTGKQTLVSAVAILAEEVIFIK